ncbi:L-dopachrome tautomerase-related protein [Acetobacter sp.]|uniref:L-dopachrome tautomerase-related protein n=1 Tax=Acetobacter sp. TaxID=440 RepID=UPI0025BC6478|nr:L-dopachrome tautomerase-related protein [Acetobacter sp.]MCH4091139.1 bleomycin resistance protein [Acetobacter sp.]MCI1301267.1 bleomycin resistance protein [Acetobacter sp.]MCI1317551.1 bleomycin resistance protein [Acetobacter sp.]
MMPLNRRAMLGGLVFATSGLFPRSVLADEKLSVAARSPFIASGVAVAHDGTVFLGMPRFPGMEHTFSLARVNAAGEPVSFPGGHWNDWREGQDGSNSFVMVNAIHIFRDNTLWAVDQGAPAGQRPPPGAQKLVQLDTTNGNILRILRFPEAVMPSGAQFNDLRIHGNLVFVTDSGLGGVIIHDPETGMTLRRLSGQVVMRNDGVHLHKGIGDHILQDEHAKRPDVASDDIEVDATGIWFYFSVPAGPLKRIRIADLLNVAFTDDQLAKKVEIVAEIPSIGGTCIDTLGNIYLSDAENCCITVLAPDGKRAILVQDSRLISPDALFIDRHRRLYIPCPQLQKLAMFNNGHNETHPPFLVLSMVLPASLNGITLGEGVEG